MSESLIQHRAEVQGLATAILLPSVSVFGESLERVPGSAGPLTQVVGIGLFQRAVLTLQRAGIRQLIVLAGPEEDQLKQALGRGPRVTIPVRWMPIREFPLDDPRTWEAMAAEVHGFCLVASVRGVFSRGLIESLRRGVQEGQAILVAQPVMQRAAGDWRVSVKVQAERLLALGSSRAEDALLVAADVLVLPAGLMAAAQETHTPPGTMPIRRWIEQAAIDGRVRVLRTDGHPSQWYQDVRTQAEVPAAERKLFSSLKGEFEGFVDRYFNRKVSRWFTRIFLAIGASPNAITMVATVLGLLAAVGFGLGTYEAAIVAALLFQFAAVIDCCDGEVARLTFTESAFGAWLDIAMDNVVHMAIFAGIAVGAYQQAAGQADAWIPLALGAAAVLGNAASFVLVTRAQKIKAASGWKTPIHAAWSEFMLKNVASRDFSVIVLIAAVVGKLDWFLWMASAGSLVFTALMLWVIRPSARSRA
ncbi:CDP-alcohol phosphatidyltransferase family protein [Nitrospira lenta]|uniref:Bifunctional IPC transferase and DIPP synthase n=1 Tax=Nitrospira lenta TaxID=1436998 RepID=A0A330L1N4_9BACT|nr:CDP-alcohol phosphatidyltransferase family protein [Nitrospira lenta]SPP63665.1 putative sugar nucleotidyltransferase and phosphatidyltransferase (Bifunctional enzyme) [Nitrospira lenta]